MSKDKKKIEIKEGILVIPEKRLRIRSVETNGFEEFKEAILFLAGETDKQRKKRKVRENEEKL